MCVFWNSHCLCISCMSVCMRIMAVRVSEVSIGTLQTLLHCDMTHPPPSNLPSLLELHR